MSTATFIRDIALRGPWSREHELLLHCARTHLSRPTLGRIHSLLEDNLEWAYLLEAAVVHRVVPLMYRSLQKVASDRVPQQVRTWLRTEYLQEGMRIHLQILQLLDLLSLFDARGIEALSFKGPVLGMVAYGDASKRKAGDLDLLIRRDDFPAARKVLVDRGYTPQTAAEQEEGYLKYRSGSPFRSDVAEQCNVDLHITLEQRPFDGFPFSMKLGFEAVWDRSQTVVVHGTPVRTLSTDDTLLHVCSNSAKDSWARLTKICDIAELIQRQRVNWSVVLRRARTTNTERILCVSLVLASALLEAPLPEEVEQAIRQDPAVQTLAMEVSEWLFDPASAASKKVGRTFSESLTHHRFRVHLLQRPDEKVRYVLYRGLRKLSKTLPGG